MAQKKLCRVIHSWRLLVWHNEIIPCHSQFWRLLVWHNEIHQYGPLKFRELWYGTVKLTNPYLSQFEAFSMAQ